MARYNHKMTEAKWQKVWEDRGCPSLDMELVMDSLALKVQAGRFQMHVYMQALLL